MDNEKCMCYITYAVPSERMLEFIPGFRQESYKIEEEFVPQWFNAGAFPEDDIDD